MEFIGNHGLLLAAGVGYNVLLSAIPMFGLLALMLSQFLERERFLAVIAAEARVVAPGQVEQIIGTVNSLLDTPEVLGVVGLAMLLFLSSLAFRMLEDAIAILFRHTRRPPVKRSAWFKALLPYLFVLTLGAALFLLTACVVWIEAWSERAVQQIDDEPAIDGAIGVVFYIAEMLGVALLFAAIYKVLPVTHISVRRALFGGAVAALLWELVRRALVYYFASVSIVNVVYGSAAAVVVLLLSLEAGAVVLLLGAQVIALLEEREAQGRAWHGETRAAARAAVRRTSETGR
ncbi:MAG: YihY/virulence factor BrkB family protein [Gammaproteobacteria bacterium]